MTQHQFVKWLLHQNLTELQVRMAAILFAVNGYENAREFVEKVKNELQKR